ncbi:MAG: prepilin-type N-terminal cleavage/methylation domain-containing protein [Candidatus Berkelbacteria bacterium]|nr:prepilin-type N-terminal cleavage/methylation domain-containing protein [Candidatus Berkelbacteria bacterium]
MGIKKRKVKSFTLIELLIVIIIVGILATFVAISLVSSRAKARDDKRLADINSIANAIDQYSTEHSRKYPIVTGGGQADEDAYYVVRVSRSTFVDQIDDYLRPVPEDPSDKAGSEEYRYIYVVKGDRLKAALIVDKMEKGRSKCNIPSNNTSGVPDTVTAYIDKIGGTVNVVYVGSITPPTNPNPCYYVER